MKLQKRNPRECVLQIGNHRNEFLAEQDKEASLGDGQKNGATEREKFHGMRLVNTPYL
jgi:hypothetical protein